MANPMLPGYEGSKETTKEEKDKGNSYKSKREPDRASDKRSGNAIVLKPKEEFSEETKIPWGVGAGLVLAAGSVIAAPFALGALGFTQAGVAAGSVAASYMSASAATAGSVFSGLQSAGAAGLGLFGYGVAAAARGATGAGVGFLFSHFPKVRPTTEEQKTIFRDHDSNSDGFLTLDEFIEALSDLKIELNMVQLKKAYTSATGREELGNISMEEFLKLFQEK